MKTFLFKVVIRLFKYLGEDARASLFEELQRSHRKVKHKKFREMYSIHESFRLNGDQILFYGEGEIVCGMNSYVGNYSTIQCDKSCRVTIGSGCHISHNVRIYTTTNVADQPFNVEVKNSLKGDVLIEDFVWIGANVFIGPNVTIGRNSVIGANSVVTRDVPANSIWAGAPLRLIREKTIRI